MNGEKLCFPARFVKGLFDRFINNSNCLSADWIRRQKMKKFTEERKLLEVVMMQEKSVELRPGLLILTKHSTARIVDIVMGVIRFDNGLEVREESVQLMLKKSEWSIVTESRRYV